MDMLIIEIVCAPGESASTVLNQVCDLDTVLTVKDIGR